MILKHYKCPTVIVMQPCNWLLELDFRLCGCAGIRLWDLLISASDRMAICLFIKLVIHGSMFTRLSVCLLLPCFHIVQSSSPVLLVIRFLQFFHGHNPFNLKLLKAILKYLETFLNVLIFKLQCYRERLLLSPLI